MKKVLPIICFLFSLLMTTIGFPDGFAALMLVLTFSIIIVLIIREKFEDDANFLIQIFVSALLARLAFGLILHYFDIRNFFGGDAITYDVLGFRLTEIWFDNASISTPVSQQALSTSGSGWGMSKLVGIIYSITGRNILAAQSFCAVFGAATVPLVYVCAFKIFNNGRVARISAILVAFYPAFIIWTGQLLKDGLVIFLLVASIVLVLRLQEKLRYTDVILLGLSLSAIITLRFYVFYMAALAVVGAFVIGTSSTPTSIFRRIIALAILGFGMTYFGLTQNVGNEFETYGNLKVLQTSREDLAKSADSGYGADYDVSTTGGAISVLPIGFLYLLLAPFPWQMNNFRQLISLPEVLLWWASIPFLISGLIYAIKKRLRSSIPIVIFSLMLTLLYSIFSGNVGTAYRQRTQIQVFLFIFIAVGWTLWREKQENIQVINQSKKAIQRG